MVITAFEWAKDELKVNNLKFKVGKLLEKHDRIDSIPFSSERRFFASLHRWDKKNNIVFVNGAPEMVLEKTTLSNSQRLKVMAKIEKLTSEGKRIIGLARKGIKKSKKKLNVGDVKSDLEWVGILAFTDPIRSGVKEALSKTKKAGIRLIVITGDYPSTAVSVMKQLGIHICENCMTLGNKLKKFKIKSLAKKLSRKHAISLFARTTPQQKLKIVEALKRSGEVVAMMGDGVNDAPALKKADIGIVVGEATDVAKESADLVLLDSSFATIVSAIEEGRGIFDNIRKIILYLMSDSFEEIFAVVATIIVGLPLPVTAAQILWINLVSDGFPDMALTIDPRRSDIMNTQPRSPKESLVAPWMRYLILIISLAGGVMAFLVFVFFYKTTDSLPLAQSMAFATLGVNSLVYVFSVRTLTDPFWKQSPFINKWLNLSVLAGLFLQVLPFTSPALRKFFGVTTLSFSNWTIVFGMSFIMFAIIEVSKFIFEGVLERHHKKHVI
jgi:Ca2+-transporting ATPase